MFRAKQLRGGALICLMFGDLRFTRNIKKALFLICGVTGEGAARLSVQCFARNIRGRLMFREKQLAAGGAGEGGRGGLRLRLFQRLYGDGCRRFQAGALF